MDPDLPSPTSKGTAMSMGGERKPTRRWLHLVTRSLFLAPVFVVIYFTWLYYAAGTLIGGSFCGLFEDPEAAREVTLGAPVVIPYRGGKITLMPLGLYGDDEDVIEYSLRIEGPPNNLRRSLETDPGFRKLLLQHLQPPPNEIYDISVGGVHYHLRTTLPFALLAGIVLCWSAARMWRAGRQEAAVEAIENLNGDVRYACQIAGMKQPGPLWLHKLLGRDFFDTVALASLAETAVTDAYLEQLKRLPHLRQLYLDRTQVTDAGLEHLTRLTRLQALSLADTKVTDQGVNKLQQALPNCKIKR
jgi:hypothetical protein